MLAVELRERVSPYIARLQAEGLLLLRSGATTLRMLPPYLISEEDVNFSLKALDAALHMALTGSQREDTREVLR